MRFHAKGALVFLLLCVAAARVALAQEKQASSNGAYRATRETPNLPPNPIGSRALTRREGLAILDVAWTPAIMLSLLSTALTLSTESMRAPVCLMNTRALPTFMWGSTNSAE